MQRHLLEYLFGARRVSEPLPDRAFRSPFRFERFDGLVLALYTLVLAWAVPHHRPWIDEAQAWMIARDDSMRDMLLRRLHYEGAPPLWHLILKAAHALHMPYAGLNWMGAAFALAGIFVFLKYSPFPRAFRWLLPFTFYLQYQYAVIARPYVLFPLLLFTLCLVFCLERPRLVLFGVVAGLLANINAHAGMLACIFACLYLQRMLVPSQGSERRTLDRPLKRQLASATAVFVGLCALSVLSAYPAPDAMVAPVATGHVKPAKPFLVRLLPPERMPASAPLLDLSLDEATALRASRRDATPPVQLVQQERLSLATRLHRRLAPLLPVCLDVSTFPVAESNALSVVFLALFGCWLWFRKSLRYALPWLIAVPLASSIWIYDHHTGMFGLALVAAAWISLRLGDGTRIPQPLAAAISAVALLVLLLQVGWTAHAIHAERRTPYDPGKQVEAFLAENEAGRRVAGYGFQTVSVQPYATHNLFFNWDHTYWLWSNSNPIDMRRTEVFEQHPDAVVVSDLIQEQDSLYNQWRRTAPAGVHPYAEMQLFWQEHGYHETHRFCGTRFMRAGRDNTQCELIYEPGSTDVSNAGHSR